MLSRVWNLLVLVAPYAITAYVVGLALLAVLLVWKGHRDRARQTNVVGLPVRRRGSLRVSHGIFATTYVDRATGLIVLTVWNPS